jgi:hypothetical protein
MRILFLAASLASANLTLAIELVMALGLTFGAWLAHRRCYRVHAWCQSAIVLLNLLVIATYMVLWSLHLQRMYVREFLRSWATKLGHSFYGIATAHAILGSAVEVAGLYVILSAGTKILPNQFRLSNLKTGMRILLACWWLVFARIGNLCALVHSHNAAEALSGASTPSNSGCVGLAPTFHRCCYIRTIINDFFSSEYAL